MPTTKNDLENILMNWATEQTTTLAALKTLAHEIDSLTYHDKPIIISTESRGREYLSALLREAARRIE